MEIQYLTSAHHLKVCEPHVMAIGFFDGVHLGHQQLFTKARIVAQELDIKSSVFTFSSHPNEVINGEQNRKYITPLREKMKKIATCGIDKAYVMEFDQSLASLLPFDFIKKYIIDMNVCHVVVGFDFTFGLKAMGNIKTLKTVASKYGFGLTVVSKKTYQNEKISSTAIRRRLYSGNVKQVRPFLGEDYKIKSTIRQLLSINHAYIVIEEPYILPKSGVYNVYIRLNNKLYPGKLTIQSNETDICYLESINILFNENMKLDILFLNRINVGKIALV